MLQVLWYVSAFIYVQFTGYALDVLPGWPCTCISNDISVQKH